tara:strand:+ start:20894 stop:21061 length:168 start_codon:yes stop_codon:yes gene_type:complete
MSADDRPAETAPTQRQCWLSLTEEPAVRELKEASSLLVLDEAHKLSRKVFDRGLL